MSAQDLLVPIEPVPAPSVDPRFEEALTEARAADSRTDYVTAAAAYERYAEQCLRATTAALVFGHPCLAAEAALRRAFELHRAIGDFDRAEADADAFTTHFLYAQPIEAIEVGYALVRMHLVNEEPRRASAALDRFEALHPDPSPAEGIVTASFRAQIAGALGQRARAVRYWRSVERMWDLESRELARENAEATDEVRAAVAEGRLVRAEGAVDRFLSIGPPRAVGDRETDRWWSEELSPWVVRTRRRLALARIELERVYELGSPRHSVMAAAQIGEMYGHVFALHGALEIDNELMRALVNGGTEPAGYEEARAHLETCIDWASHHGVARAVASRCERALQALDPVRYPLPAELHGQASYHPVGVAMPRQP